MKKLKAKLKAILSSNKGESLMESLISMVVFAIMIEAVTLMIMTALRMNSSSITKATASQTSINNEITGVYDTFAERTMTLSWNDIETGEEVEVEIELEVSDYGAFRPKG